MQRDKYLPSYIPVNALANIELQLIPFASVFYDRHVGSNEVFTYGEGRCLG